VLGARVGDLLILEVLEGRRVTRTAPLVGLAEDFAGIAAYMDLHALNRCLAKAMSSPAPASRSTPSNGGIFCANSRASPG
jgi:hypothetical protein